MWALTSPRALNVGSRLSLAFLALFLVLLSLSAWVYPGGTWQDPKVIGHRWLENYWCDLLRHPALNGGGNALGRALGTAAFACLGLSLLPFWLELSRLLGGRRGALVRSAGALSAIATVAVALLPSDGFPKLHAPAVITAGCLGLASGCLCASWAIGHRRSAPVFAAASVALLCLALLNLGLYVHVAYFDGADTALLPTLQKLATLCLVVWISGGLLASADHPRP